MELARFRGSIVTPTSLSKTIAPLRTDGAKSRLIARAKRQLLEWAESQPWRFTRNPDLDQVTKQLNQGLDLKESPEDNSDFLGGFGLELSRPAGDAAWLELTTSFGVQCGSDTSVYLYEWFDNAWTRRLSIAADASGKDKYDPRQSLKVEVSLPDAAGSRLVLATGWPPACMSVWQPLFTGARARARQRFWNGGSPPTRKRIFGAVGTRRGPSRTRRLLH